MKPDKTKRYRVGGVSSEKIQEVVKSLKDDGATIEIVNADAHPNRVSLHHQEMIVEADDRGVLGLLSIRHAVVGVCQR
jgi:hypothetical protein